MHLPKAMHENLTESVEHETTRSIGRASIAESLTVRCVPAARATSLTRSLPGPPREKSKRTCLRRNARGSTPEKSLSAPAASPISDQQGLSNEETTHQTTKHTAHIALRGLLPAPARAATERDREKQTTGGEDEGPPLLPQRAHCGVEVKLLVLCSERLPRPFLARTPFRRRRWLRRGLRRLAPPTAGAAMADKKEKMTKKRNGVERNERLRVGRNASNRYIAMPMMNTETWPQNTWNCTRILDRSRPPKISLTTCKRETCPEFASQMRRAVSVT